MDCPRCGGGLATYTLDGKEAAVCEGCGYLGVPADLRHEAVQRETWTDALQRFHESTESED